MGAARDQAVDRVLIPLGVALAAGFLIGFERDREGHGDQPGTATYAGGARTLSLTALGGALATLLAPVAGVWLMAVGLAGLCLWLYAGYRLDLDSRADRGLTSELSFVVAWLLGAFVASDLLPMRERATVVLATAVVVTVLLSSKPRLHAFTDRLSPGDAASVLRFLVVAVVVLPLLPNRTYGPLDVLNPYEVGLMVVLVAAINLAGYVAVRWLGPGRGLGLTGLVGGLAASTAVTLSVSRRAREADLASAGALAIVLASTIMFPRVLLEVAVIHRPLLDAVWLPITAMAVTGLLAAAALYHAARHDEPEGPTVDLSNPVDLRNAVQFGLLFAVVLVAAKAAHGWLGAAGIHATALLAGVTDVDAITLSVARLARDGLDPDTASSAIVLAAASNTLAKAALAWFLGTRALGLRVLAAFAGVLTVGWLVVVLP